MTIDKNEVQWLGVPDHITKSGSVFMTIDKNGVQWLGVPDHITKSADNEKKLKLLTAARAEDKMGNEDHKRKDELEMQKCEMCDMHYEMCGTYLTTRSNSYEKEVPLPKTCGDMDMYTRLLIPRSTKRSIKNYQGLDGTSWEGSEFGDTGCKLIEDYWQK